MKTAKIVAIAMGVIIVILLGVLVFVNPTKEPTVSPPAGTVSGVLSPDGHVAILSPASGTSITSPITILGTVTGGGWYFEASFPVKVLDADGAVLGTGSARAQEDWTSTGTVPFVATIPFAHPRYATGTIVFLKDNPSGVPENAQSFSLPVRFQ